MQAVRTIGLDITNSVFRVLGVDADGEVAVETPLQGSSTMSRGRPLHSPRQRALRYPLLTPMMALWRR